jgi:hypothetical protein
MTGRGEGIGEHSAFVTPGPRGDKEPAERGPARKETR